jgi:hypothetical protein
VCKLNVGAVGKENELKKHQEPEENVNKSILFCPNCGKKVSVSDTFCQYCGFNLEKFAMENDVHSSQETSDPKKGVSINSNLDSSRNGENVNRRGKTHSKKKTFYIVAICLTAIIIVIIAIGGSNSYQSRSDSSSNTTESTAIPGLQRAKSFGDDRVNEFLDIYEKYDITQTDKQSKVTIMENNDTGNTTFTDGPYTGQANTVNYWYLYKISWVSGDQSYYVYVRGVYKTKNDVDGVHETPNVSIAHTDVVEDECNFSAAKTYQVSDF